MAHSSESICNGLGRAAAYTVYNLGVGIAVGIVRTAIAVAYIIKHWLNAEAYKQSAYNFRSKPNQGIFDRGCNWVDRQLDKGGQESEKALMNMWKGEFYRGVSEIFWVGAPYFTYADNFSDRKVSIFGIDELAQMMEVDEEMSGLVEGLFN